MKKLSGVSDRGMRRLAGLYPEGPEWWKASFGGGWIYFEASSSSQAMSIATDWGEGRGLGTPDTVKKARIPTDTLGSTLGTRYDSEYGVWVAE